MMKKFLIGTVLSLSALSTIASELSQYTAARVQRAHNLAQEEKLKEAISSLEAMELSRGYDQAYVARMLGIFFTGRMSKLKRRLSNLSWQSIVVCYKMSKHGKPEKCWLIYC